LAGRQPAARRRGRQPGLGRRRPRPVAGARRARGLRTAARSAALAAATPARGIHAARAGGVRRRRHGADHEMQRGLGEDAPVARTGGAATATGGFRMNNDNRDARFDAAMRQLHASAVDRVSGRTRLRLQQAPRTAPATPLPQPHRLAWPLAASFAAALALMVGVQLWNEPAPAPAAPAATPVADADADIDAVLEENPRLYLWLASNDAYALAIEQAMR